jgi:hypothetical protein
MFVIFLLFIITAALVFYYAIAGESGVAYSPDYDVSSGGSGSTHQ